MATSDILLRCLTLGDASYVMELENDANNWQYSSFCDAPYSLSEIRLFCKQCEVQGLQVSLNCDFLRLGVEYSGQLVGLLDLYDVDLQSSCAYVSVIIYPGEHRGKGIALSALRQFIELCYTRFGITRFCAEVDSENIASVQLFNKLGFSGLGLLVLNIPNPSIL